MSKRKLLITRSEYPVTGICEGCTQVFISRNEKLEVAEMHVKSQFDRHECKSGPQNDQPQRG